MAGPWDAVADVLDIGDPKGNDHKSSNWAAWGHDEIRSMLDTTVDPGAIGEAAHAWRELGRSAPDLVTRLTRDLHQAVSDGWRGGSADVAITALGPINQWSATVAQTASNTTQLMDASGLSAGQAKAAVPPPMSHNWVQSLGKFVDGGVIATVTDAVAQDRAQSAAHAEAVRIMNNVYSMPINDHRAAVPTYPQLVDPTLRPPEQHLNAGPAPGSGYGGAAMAGAGILGAGMPGVGVPGAGAGGYVPHSPPAAAALQGVTGGAGTSTPAGGGAVAPDQAARGPHHPGGLAAAAGVPIAGGAAYPHRRAGGGSALGGGRAAGQYPVGGGRIGTGGAAAFGPQRSAEVADSRPGGVAARGVNAPAAGRAGMGSMMPPMAGAGGRGKDGEDTEHRRPSYLVEMDDIFGDGRKVAPPVIGEDPPEPGR